MGKVRGQRKRKSVLFILLAAYFALFIVFERKKYGKDTY